MNSSTILEKKKVLSFCLYGCKAMYIIGMKENIDLAKLHFPDWEVRIHYNSTVPEKYIDEYKELGANCILCKNLGINKMNWEGMFWRWLPLDDDNVDVWISRDADSRLSEREANLIGEWMKSGKTLHCIRDHRCHAHCIMGGMFGINNKLFRSKYQFKKVEQIIDDLYKYYKERPYNVDQIFLNDTLWSVLSNDVIAHVSNGGRKVYATDIEIASCDDFVGKQYRLDDNLIKEKMEIPLQDIQNGSIFRIKSKYTDLYLDVFQNNVVKLAKSSDSPTQLWKYENDKIINVSNKMFLCNNSSNDTILKPTFNSKWQIQEGGFIICDNKALDMKGGVRDPRWETWMFKLNWSEAQQWDLVKASNEELQQNYSFRIKSLHKDLYITYFNITKRVKLSQKENKKSQLWKFKENEGQIVCLSNNKYLDYNESGQYLTVSDNSSKLWEIKDDYFVFKGNKAIDFKGGVNDNRKEVWIFKLNYSQAQQWVLEPEFEEYSDEIEPPVKSKNYEKKVLILNHNYHHKNKKGMELMCDYLNYEVLYGGVSDIKDADVIYCPSHPHDARNFPNKRFIFGPHLSIFPDQRLDRINNTPKNCFYIQPSPWARDVWIHQNAEKHLPVKSFPFTVETDKFLPISAKAERTEIFIMFKHRDPNELKFVEDFLRNKGLGYRVFKYGCYNEDDYLKYLQKSKYGIWIGRHESQGFALHESLSCDVPLLVWSVMNMQQQYGWAGCPDVPGTTIPYWDTRCGEYFNHKNDFEATYNKFIEKIDTYRARSYILDTVSVEQCAKNFKEVFLGERQNADNYKIVSCCDDRYFNAVKSFINNYKNENLNFSCLTIYDLGLSRDHFVELIHIQNLYHFDIRKLDYSKYPEHVDLTKYNGLKCSYAFKPVLIYEQANMSEDPVIYMDSGCGFTKNTIEYICDEVRKNHFWVSIANNKGTIESKELNHKDTLQHFNVDKNDIITCSANAMGLNYSNNYCKDIIDKWYQSCLDPKIITPEKTDRNNHRQDQSVLSCVLHNSKFTNFSNAPGFQPWKYGGIRDHKNYKCCSWQRHNAARVEGIIYVNNIEEAYEILSNRKDITKDELLRDFKITI